MVAQVRAELVKFFSTRLWWGMAAGIAVAAAAFALLFSIVLTLEDTSSVGGPGGAPVGDATQIANTVYTAGIGVGYLLLLTIGVMQIGSEYRHKTISATFLASPRRGVVMGAKVVTLLILGVVYGLLSLLVSVAVGATMLHLRGADPFPSTDVVRTLALGLLVLGLWGLIGLGIGILIPNQVAALLIGIGAAWIVEPLVGFGLSFVDGAREYVVPYLPSQATNAVLDAVQQSPDEVRLSWWAGALVLAAYAAVLAGVGSLRVIRQDIS